MIRCQLIQQRPLRIRGLSLDWTNIQAIILCDHRLLMEDEYNNYVSFEPNQERNGFKFMNYRLEYKYNLYRYDAGVRRFYSDMYSSEFKGDTIEYSYVSPRQIGEYQGLALNRSNPIAEVGKRVSVSEEMQSINLKGEVRLFQFMNKWVTDINLIDRSRFDSFVYTKGIQDDLARAIKLPFNLRLMSWEGILESDETGVITNENLLECWNGVINQLTH